MPVNVFDTPSKTDTSNPGSWTVITAFDPASPYSLQVQGEMLDNGGNTTLNRITYGGDVTVTRFKDGRLDDKYTLVFTNLPVIQLTADVISDEPKHEGTFQLSSGHFSQSTDHLKMGIEIRGATSQVYPKKELRPATGRGCRLDQ